MKQWNPRYLAYCRAHGNNDPEAMLEQDREKYPGGCMCGFILWLQNMWSQFHKFMEVPANSETAYSQKYHDKFDLWLNITTA